MFCWLFYFVLIIAKFALEGKPCIPINIEDIRPTKYIFYKGSLVSIFVA
ncbi:Uncharacterised protein [Sphingobacterium thalpophilum]|uniref:Uncharacterized protein n=1 Tax=Sphingobacterium thalpophilum TaxID=259 RepID=A0A4U9URY2_9SPHI|nr:Uncharacterised protein [Sphingobacterium thalpophilum]